MRGRADSVEFLSPSRVEDALDLYSRNPHALPLAGGTDLLVAWNAGLLNGKTVLDLSRLPWTRVEAAGKGLRIGSLATHTQLRRHAVILKRYPLLAAACGTVGSVQIQNRGTLGGSIANASPAGDVFPALAVYEAVVRTASARGYRELPFLEVFAGVKKTSLSDAELIESISLPPLRRPTRQLWRKVGTRAAQAISRVTAAGLLWLGPGRKVLEFRFALGSMAPTVVRLHKVEAFIQGKPLTERNIEEAVGLLDDDVSPIDDFRATREYRLWVSKNILRSLLR
ncbi:MAG: xanthine dehydrogenase family protein subunit M [Elusimicrobiota bacterium]